MQLVIADLGTGNLRSVLQAVEHVAPDQQVIISSDVEKINAADRVVIPGQGAMGTWVSSYESLGIDQAIRNALSNKPCLGICVGMQVMFDRSTEDNGVDGLGIFPGQVEHFNQYHAKDLGAKVPHMGWNIVEQSIEHPLWHKIDKRSYFYYVHSYSATTPDSSVVMGTTDYHHKFVAAVGRDNVFATQFHPEKSADSGLQLLRNFVNWDGKP